MEHGFRDILLAADVFDRWVCFRLPQNALGLFGAVLFLLRQTSR